MFDLIQELCEHSYLNCKSITISQNISYQRFLFYFTVENTLEFGCDAILCPPETFHMNGAASNYGGCRQCIIFADEDPTRINTASNYLGQTSCENTNFMFGDIDADGTLSQREILRLLYSATNGNWGQKYVSWKSKNIPECQLPGGK